MPDAALAELVAVSRHYGPESARVHALRNVDATIARGEHVALLGPSGSGKSTLMHVLGCLDTPSSGTYRFDGTDVGTLDVAARAALRGRSIGFVFQGFHLMPRQTALENVAMPLRFRGVGRRDRLLRAADLLDRIGLSDRREHLPHELSGGQQQRVAVARALVGEPDLLVLADEPTGNLDSRAGADVIELLEGLVDERRSLVIVTHDGRIADRAKRVVRLLDGRIVADEV